MGALERNEDVARPFHSFERGGTVFGRVRRVIADRQRVAVQFVDPLPRLPFGGPFRVLEVDGGRLRARVHADCACV